MVISISGMSGAGKTTITKKFCEEFDDYTAYFYDDYEDSNIEPDDWLEWMIEGADFNEFRSPELLNDIKSSNSKNLILDFPFARMLPQFSQLIDKAIYLDLPVEEALNRRLNRGDVNDQIVGKELDLFSTYHESISPTCDLIIDSMKTIEEILNEIKLTLNEQ